MGSRRNAISALALYVITAFGMTALVWGHPTQSFVGELGDPYKFMSFLGWIPHALSAGHNPLFMDAIDYPRGVNLAWDTPMPLAAVAIWPVTALFGVVAAYNVYLLIALTLDGWCTYLWLRRYTRTARAAFVGGFIIEVGPYASAHLLGHPNLLSFYPIPLLFIAVEHLVAPSRTWWKPALAIGLLTAIEFYLSEELAALALIAVGVALALAALLHRRAALDRVRAVIRGFLVAGAVFAVLAAPMLAFQFFGPNRIHGPIQPYNVYVTNLANLVIPTDRTWLRPDGLSAAQMAVWTGNDAEQTGYIGIPLIAVALWVAIRHWRQPLVRVIALTTAFIEILSFGPSLHLGAVNTPIRLPSIVFGHIPVLDNLLPGRLSLIAGFGFALLLTVALDQTLFLNPRRAIVGSVLSILSVACLLPPGPVPASSPSIPQYFTAFGAARQLPAGSVALVGPYTVDSSSVAPMLWQAQSDYRFALIDGLAITPGPSGRATFLLSNDISLAFRIIQRDGATPAETPRERQLLERELTRDHVSVIIIGPMPHRDEAVALISWLTGKPPQQKQGVSLWAWPSE